MFLFHICVLQCPYNDVKSVQMAWFVEVYVCRRKWRDLLYKRHKYTPI